MMNIVHFGAGNIGRGLIGALVRKDKHHLTFLDTNQEIIDSINRENSYNIKVINDSVSTETVKNVTCINSINQKDLALSTLREADIITTFVGVDNLGKITDIIIEAILGIDANDRKIQIIANENSINASDTLKHLIYDKLDELDRNKFDKIAIFSNSAIDRQALNYKGSATCVAVESYSEWIIKKTNDSKFDNKITNALYVVDMDFYIERKLYIVNAAHAAAAYIGSYYGKNTIQEALENKEIFNLVESMVQENSKYLELKYDVSNSSNHEFIDTSLKRHSNPLLKDDINRVARNPLRKLSQKERIVGCLEYLYEKDEAIEAIISVIAYAFIYENSDDQESVTLKRKMDEDKVLETIKDVTSIENIELLNLIRDKIETYKKRKDDRNA